MLLRIADPRSAMGKISAMVSRPLNPVGIVFGFGSHLVQLNMQVPHHVLVPVGSGLNTKCYTFLKMANLSDYTTFICYYLYYDMSQMELTF